MKRLTSLISQNPLSNSGQKYNTRYQIPVFMSISNTPIEDRHVDIPSAAEKESAGLGSWQCLLQQKESLGRRVVVP